MSKLYRPQAEIHGIFNHKRNKYLKALRNHKKLTAFVAILVVLAIGAAAYIILNKKDSSPAASNNNVQNARNHRPPIKNPSDVKPGTKVPGSPTSTSSTPPSDATSGPAPKAGKAPN